MGLIEEALLMGEETKEEEVLLIKEEEIEIMK